MVWPLLLSLGGGFLIFGQIFSGEPGIGVLAGVAAVLGGAAIAGAMPGPWSHRRAGAIYPDHVTSCFRYREVAA